MSGKGTHAWQACRSKSAPGTPSLNLHRRLAPRNRPTGMPTHAAQRQERWCVTAPQYTSRSRPPHTRHRAPHIIAPLPAPAGGGTRPPPPDGASCGGSPRAVHRLPSRLLWFAETPPSACGHRRPQTACSVTHCARRCVRVSPPCTGAPHLPEVGHYRYSADPGALSWHLLYPVKSS